MNSLQDKFKKEIAKKIQTNLGIKNPMSVPKLSKIVINMGVKDVLADKKNLEKASRNFSSNYRTKTQGYESQKIYFYV